jgi:hypothetical protein
MTLHVLGHLVEVPRLGFADWRGRQIELMDPIERQERKREAWRRLRAQRRRAGELRGRVAVVSLVGFALLWAVVFAQMATGNDPVLGDKPTALNPAAARPRAVARAAKEAESRTDPETGEVGEPAEEPVETIEPEELEAEILGPQAPEPELVEPEPITTSQS